METFREFLALRYLALDRFGLDDDARRTADEAQVDAVEQRLQAAVLEIALADHLAHDQARAAEERMQQEERHVHVALRRHDDRWTHGADDAHEGGDRTPQAWRIERVHRHVVGHVGEIRPHRLDQHEMRLEARAIEMAQQRHDHTLGAAAP